MGLPEEAVRAALLELPETDIEVWPWQVNAVNAFMVASTQWRYVSNPDGGSRRTSLDYTAAKVAWEFLKVSVDPDEFMAIRVIEVTVLNGGKDVGH